MSSQKGRRGRWMSFPSTRPASPKALEARFRYLCPLGQKQIPAFWKMFFFCFSWGSMRWHCRFIMAPSCNLVFFLSLDSCQKKTPQNLRDHPQVPNGMWHIRCLCWNTNSLNCGPPLVSWLENCGVGLGEGLVSEKKWTNHSLTMMCLSTIYLGHALINIH